MPISQQTYQRVALEDPDGQWELWCGRLRQKPTMTTEHNRTIDRLYRQMAAQLSDEVYGLRTNTARVRVASGDVYLPDLCVVPVELERRLTSRPGTFEVYEDALPLIVEVWSPSTGMYDRTTKLADYQRRGDAEIWLLHPYRKTLTAYRRQPDGTYTETQHQAGVIAPSALPGVTIDLARLFA